MKNEIILYRPNELAEQIEVRFDEDTVWLTQAQIAELFGTNSQAITKHINNIYSTGELDKISTCSILEQVRQEGSRKVKRQVANYNLDMIISVGYRVNSVNATLFRRWATTKLKEYLLKGYSVNNRMNRIEDNVDEIKKDYDTLKNKVDEIDLQINSHQIPTQGVIFDGQVFDAYSLTSKIIRLAKHSIVLIDNYIDDNTLTHLAKKSNGVKVLLLTNNISKQLSLDVKKADAQYGNFVVKQFTQSHDRFLIIDNGKEVYHIGASLKDLGKKWFAFSKMDSQTVAHIITAISGLI
ncbi:MAG: virulence RhuM family protein [Oscillospiraceae bacterium]|nr:virulence RhuM family protein [Oscillospiraceae bacterium]